MDEQQQGWGRPAFLEFNAEQLEGRLLLDGNVTARVLGGNLVVTGDEDANGVHITQVGGGQYMVTGIDCGNGATTINGEASALLTGVTRSFRVTLRGGADCLHMGNGETSPEGNGGLYVPDDLFIRTNAGSDEVRLDDIHVEDMTKIWLETGNDGLEINSGEFDRDLFVFGQNGVDQMEIVDVTVEGRLYVKSHRGDDVIGLSEVYVSNQADVNTGDGADEVVIGPNLDCGDCPGVGVQARNLFIQTGNGEDELELRDSDVSNRLLVLMGNGNDRVTARDNSANQAWLNGNAPFQLVNGEGDAINADVQFTNTFNQLKLFDSFEIFVV